MVVLAVVVLGDVTMARPAAARQRGMTSVLQRSMKRRGSGVMAVSSS